MYSKLIFFEDLILGNGKEKIKDEFLKLSDSKKIDERKEFDPSKDELVIYLFREKIDSNGEVTLSDESYPHRFSNYLEEKIDLELNAYLLWINNLPERYSLEKTQTLLKDHIKRVRDLSAKVKNEEGTPLKEAIDEISLLLDDKRRTFGIQVAPIIKNTNAGRKPHVDDEILKEQALKLIKASEESSEGDEYYHCVHKTGNHKGKPNYSNIAKILFEEEDYSSLFESNEGLQKAIKRALSK